MIEDRKKLRRLIKKLHQPGFSADEFVESFGIDVPYIGKEPNLLDYGLVVDDPNLLKKQDEYFSEKNKLTAKNTFILLIIVGAVFGYMYEGVTGAIAGAIVAAWPIGFFAYLTISERKPPDSKLRQMVKQYEIDCSNYQYWQRKRSRDYWKGLSGHGFEDALAQLFRKRGFHAVVSKSGGDEGIDIILEKDGMKSIVQCKAHAKPIGPVVARELYGAMLHFNVERGILASTFGFTDGVHKFVADKKIELLNLDDILKMADSLDS